MSDEDQAGLRVRRDAGIVWVTIDHPPVNLLDLTLIRDLVRLVDALEVDSESRVVVLQSANPEFFIAHADVGLLLTLPPAAPAPADRLGPFHDLVERFRTLPKATIGKVEGIARGGGSELLLSLDMRFGALGRAVLGQPEVALGIVPGGGGTQRLPRLVGRARALEVVLGCDDVPADLAERWGYLNRALPPEELTPFVERLARRIASFPAEAVARAKAAVAAAEPSPVPGLIEEGRLFQETLALPETRRRMQRFLDAGGQTPAVERDLQRLIDVFPG